MDNSRDNIDLSEIIDEMKPIEFRINKAQNFSTSTLPKTKFNEEYFTIKQINEKKRKYTII